MVIGASGAINMNAPLNVGGGTAGATGSVQAFSIGATGVTSNTGTFTTLTATGTTTLATSLTGVLTASSGVVSTATIGTGLSFSSGTLSNSAPASSITDDSTTNTSYYPVMAAVTTGTPSTVYTSSTKLYFNPSTGTINATIYNSLSDKRKKKNIKSIENAADTVSQLNGVEFQWKNNGIKSYGVIAQELEQVIPDLVTTDDDGNKSVNYNGLLGFLINAIKEQQVEINKLKDKLNDNT
jgi:hypothetical protein